REKIGILQRQTAYASSCSHRESCSKIPRPGRDGSANEDQQVPRLHLPSGWTSVASLADGARNWRARSFVGAATGFSSGDFEPAAARSTSSRATATYWCSWRSRLGRVARLDIRSSR